MRWPGGVQSKNVLLRHGLYRTPYRPLRHFPALRSDTPTNGRLTVTAIVLSYHLFDNPEQGSEGDKGTASNGSHTDPCGQVLRWI